MFWMMVGSAELAKVVERADEMDRRMRDSIGDGRLPLFVPVAEVDVMGLVGG
jgi:hypothetical protein